MAIKITSTEKTTIVKSITVGAPIRSVIAATGTFSGLTDVTITNAANQDFLQFDSSSQKFVNRSSPVFTTIASNLIPSVDSSFDLGSSSRKWKDLHLSGSTINLGGLTIKDQSGSFSVADSTGSAVSIDLAGSQSQIRGFFSGAGDLTYNSGTGQFSIDVESVYTKANFDSDFNSALDDASIGGAGLTFNSASNTLSITNTGVDSAVVGSATQVPVLTINARGQIDSAGVVTVAGVSSIAFDSASGVFTINTADGNSFAATIADSDFTASRARDVLSVVDAGGDGSLAYDSALGKFTYTGPSASEVRAHLSGGTGVTYNSGTGQISIGQAVGTSDNVTFNQLRGPAEFLIDPATVGDNTGTVKILGNLQVEGTQTVINSTTVSVNDKNIVLADSAADAAAADGAGITINGASASLTYSASGDKFVFNKPFEGEYLGFDSDFDSSITRATAVSAIRGNLSGGTGITYNSSTGAISTTDGDIVHDNLSGFVANEHIDHSTVSVVAGKGLTGGGTIAANRTIDIDSANVRGMLSGGTGITYNSGTGAISTTDGDIVHDNLSGFVANEHIDHTSVSVIAGKGLSGGGTIASSRTIDIDSANVLGMFSAGEGIDISSGEISGENATTTNKGIASFDSSSFTVGSGAVSIKTDGINDTHIDFGTGTNQVSTADVPEETNLYFTNARAKGAAVADAINNGTTDVAPSQNAVFDALALKLDASAVPTLGGDFIDSAIALGLIDSAYVAARAPASDIDSAEVISIVDSAYVQARQSATGGTDTIFKTISVAGQSNIVADTTTDVLTVAGSTGITVTTNAGTDTITFATTDGDIVHDNLSGFVANEHIDHTSVSVTAGDGLTGGGTIASTRTLNVVGGKGITANADDIQIDSANIDTIIDSALSEVSIIAGKGLSGGGTLVSDRTIDIDSANVRGMLSGGTGITYNSGTGAISTTDGDIVHDNLSGFVDDEHIDHKSVSVIAGKGLSGGGTIAADRTIDIDSSNVRGMFSATDAGGDGSFSYNSGTGAFTYTGPSAAEVKAHFQPLDSSANPTFNQLRGPAEFVIDPATIGDATGTVKILGNLQVEGTQTTINSTTVSINDKNIVIADSAADSSALDGGGITWGGSSIANTPSLTYDHANAEFDLNRKLNLNGQLELSSGIQHNVAGGNLTIAAASSGANIELYAGDHSSQPARAFYDANIHTFRSQDGGENLAKFFDNGNVSLYHDNIVRFQTSTTGATVTGSLVADSADIGNINIGGNTISNAFEVASNGQLALKSGLTTKSVIISNATTSTIVADGTGSVPVAKLNYNGSLRLATDAYGVDVTGRVNADSITTGPVNISGDITFQDSDDIHLTDKGNLRFGDATNGDFTITHNGSNTQLVNKTGVLQIIQQASDVTISASDGASSTTPYFRADASTGEAKLNHYGNTKLTTAATGVTVTGSLVSDSVSTGPLNLTGKVTQSTTQVSELTGKWRYERTGGTENLEIRPSGSYTGWHPNILLRSQQSGSAMYILTNGNRVGIGQFDAGTGGTPRDNSALIMFQPSADSTPRIEIGDTGSVNGELNIAGQNIFGDSIGVGLGTTTPQGLLHISSETSGDATVIIEADTDNNAEGDIPQIWFKADGNITEGAIRLNDNELQIISNVSGSGIEFLTGETNNTGTTDPGSGAARRMRIDSAGVSVTGNITLLDSDDIVLPDDASIIVGTGTDLVIKHNGSSSQINNNTGTLQINQLANDQDVVINSDDGSGSTANYFRADGSTGEAILYHYGSQKLATKATGVTVTGTVNADSATVTNISLPDDGVATFGTDGDFTIDNNGSKTQLKAIIGNLDIRQQANDGDVTILSDDGTGGVTTYLKADGSEGEVQLYHYGSQKLATKATGVTVTGTMNADSATISGPVRSDLFTGATFSSNSFLDFDDDQSLASNMVTLAAVGPANIIIDTNNNDANDKLTIARGNTDIDTATVIAEFSGNEVTSFVPIVVGSTGSYTLDGDSAEVASASQTSIAEFAHASFCGAKFIVTASQGTKRQISELLVTHDGTTAVATEYGTITTDSDLASFDVDINGSDVRLLATGTSATSTRYKVVETLIEA